MNPAGYLLYLLVVLLPGLGAGELLGIWKGRTFAEALGYVVGLGLALDTLVMFVATSGLSVGGVSLSGVSYSDFYALMLAGALLYIGGLVLRRKVPSFPRPNRDDALVASIMLVQALMIYLFFQKYPIFPEYNSVDFRGHVDIVNSLLSGGTSLPGGILYYGVHYQLALGVLLTGGQTLVVIQRIGAILAVLGTPIVFLAASRIFSSGEAGVASSFLYAITASIWFGSLFDTGLYPNFFGILASLFVLALAADVAVDGARVGPAVALACAVAMLYLSHYSDVSVIPALLAVPAILALTRKFRRSSLLPSLLVVLPAGLTVALYPGLLALLQGFLANAGGNVIGGTYLSGALSPVPVIANMAAETYYDLGFVVLLLLAAFYAWRALRAREAVMLLPLAWFLSIVLISPLNAGAWRLSYVALAPLTLMAAAGLASLLPKPQKGTRRRGTGFRKVVVPLILILLVAGSWGVTVVSDSSTDPQLNAQAQQNVYDAIRWMGNNSQGTCLSVSDFRFTYTPQLIHTDTVYRFLSTPAEAILYARSVGVSCIIVTRLVTASVSPIPSLFPWNNFPTASNSNLTLTYSNPDVRIYKVV